MNSEQNEIQREQDIEKKATEAYDNIVAEQQIENTSRTVARSKDPNYKPRNVYLSNHIFQQTNVAIARIWNSTINYSEYTELALSFYCEFGELIVKDRLDPEFDLEDAMGFLVRSHFGEKIKDYEFGVAVDLTKLGDV